MEALFFKNNRKKLVEKLPNGAVAILFAGHAPHKSADEQYPFTPNRNFYYMTGIAEPNVIVTLRNVNDSLEETLYIEKSDPVMAKWIGASLTKEDAITHSGITNIHYVEDFEKQFNRSLLNDSITDVYLDMERREWGPAQPVVSQFANDLKQRYPYVSLYNVYPIIAEFRVFKTADEIAKIKEAITITKEGIYNVLRNAQNTKVEYELEAHFNFVLKSAGVKDFAFKTILASGKNATVLHYEDNDASIEEHGLILLDLGAQKDFYNADISFTFPASGTFSARQKEIYTIVLNALRSTTQIIKPGLKFADLQQHTKTFLSDACKKIGLIDEADEITRYYYHGVSHFLGLDTHDVGSYNDRVLEPGMVLTIEPGLYIEEEGIGIRIEDDILVTEDGFENLSKDIIRTPEEIEAYMKEHAASVLATK
ncbi:xaa-pro aminopeptidase [Fictibacillus macauensis ZFHKF-1]|uniref:Xaa-Pro aminopeptidase n=1 Tax=Fictibacillus macauensis ZFHKF-1 TaxID=1196324 RepID=I8J2L0_9BACL|nr:aminopeptidase P family protein [Fictibacillus macauensis]EIT85966.1 xaa-pro aminopeptidase [Fictibacillus macauensis ZFHKF-1]